MRLGIYGGSFSPPHLGHESAAQAFCDQMRLDRLLIIPTAIPPHKETTDFPTGEHRLAMCRLTFSHLPNTEVSDLEIRRTGKSYTYLTLRELAGESTELFFLCGTDMFLTLDSWRNPTELFSLAHFVMISRKDNTALFREVLQKKQLLEAQYGARITLLQTKILDVSSTEIRKAIAAGDDTSRYLLPSVDAYIREWKLYR